MGKIGINSIANMITKLWSMISIYIFIPLYIKLLGESSYGLVSFFATLQTALNILGLGLSNTLRREFASGEESVENNVRKFKLLRSIEMVYFIIGGVVVMICSLGAEFISTKWLNIEELNPQIVARVISLMGISIALQMVANLYAGCLFGLNKQMLANAYCIVWSISKSVGALLIIWIIDSNLLLFYAWHIVVDTLYLVCLRFFSIRGLNLKRVLRIWNLSDMVILKTIWRYACGILFISFVALINKQLDKVIISKYLTLSELGAYNVATTLGSLTAMIPAALYTSVFPVFTNWATTNSNDLLRKNFNNINKLTNIVISGMTAYISVFSPELISVWTGSDMYINILGNVGILVVIAVGLVEYQEIPYALALANGNTRTNVVVGGIFIPITALCTYFGIKNYGLMGAGCVYLVMMFGQTILYVYKIYKQYVTKSALTSVIKEIFVPLVFCLLLASVCKMLLDVRTDNVWIKTFVAIICGLITLVIGLFIFAKKELTCVIKGIR